MGKFELFNGQEIIHHEQPHLFGRWQVRFPRDFKCSPGDFITSIVIEDITLVELDGKIFHIDRKDKLPCFQFNAGPNVNMLGRTMKVNFYHDEDLGWRSTYEVYEVGPLTRTADYALLRKIDRK